MSGSTDSGVDVELYVRSLAPRGVHPRQRAVIETLAELTDSGIIDHYRIHVCGRQIPASRAADSTEFGAYLRNRIDVFREWADRNGWTLDEAFQHRCFESELTGESVDVLTLPVMTLAEYDQDALCFVSPVESEETTWTVQDRLDALRARADSDTADHLADARTNSPRGPTPLR